MIHHFEPFSGPSNFVNQQTLDYQDDSTNHFGMPLKEQASDENEFHTKTEQSSENTNTDSFVYSIEDEARTMIRLAYVNEDDSSLTAQNATGEIPVGKKLKYSR